MNSVRVLPFYSLQVKAFSVSGLVVSYPFGKLNNVEDVSFFPLTGVLSMCLLD